MRPESRKPKPDFIPGEVVSIHLKPVDLKVARCRDVVSGSVRRAGWGFVDLNTAWGYASVRTDEIALVVR